MERNNKGQGRGDLLVWESLDKEELAGGEQSMRKMV